VRFGRRNAREFNLEIAQEIKQGRCNVDEIRSKVQETIDLIRPALQADGGDVELVDVVDGVVQLRLVGACHGCPSASVTLHRGIERYLKERIPEVLRVESVL
jgi:Fe-S cluster biogenesis protein NfuA